MEALDSNANGNRHRNSVVRKLVGRLRGGSISSGSNSPNSRQPSQSPSWQSTLETWNAAYDSLTDDPGCTGLVMAYENIISQELPDHLKMGGLNSSFRGKSASERLNLLMAIASAGLEKRRGSDTSLADDMAKKILDAARARAAATISEQAAASIAWSGFCTLTPLLLDPIVQRDSFRTGLVHVVSRMPYYTNLSLILDSASWESDQLFREKHKDARECIIKLQRRILEFEMNCVCATASAWNAAAKNVVRWSTIDQLVLNITELDQQLADIVERYCTDRAQDDLSAQRDNCDVSAAA